MYRLTSTWLGSAGIVTLAPCFRPRVTIFAMAMITADSLHKHDCAHIPSRSSRDIRVKVYLMSGEIAGLEGMGEFEETVLTFPGSFRVTDALAECNMWVRKAKPDEEPDYKRRLQEGTEVGFIKIAPIRVLYHSTWQRAFGEQIMALNDQEHMYGMTTDETQPKEVFREVEKLINLDGIKTPTTPSESGSEPRIVFVRW